MSLSLPSDYVLPLLRVPVADLPERVLTVGDPGRVAKAAEHLADVREIAANREYATVTGVYRGEHVAVVSHGVGSAGAAVCFEELCRGGARRIVRAGTAGGLQSGITDGSVVVATGAVRDDGVSPKLVPLAYPAVADPAMTLALRDAVTAADVTAHTGIVLTSDVFYPLPVTTGQLVFWQRARCVATEMELSALLVIASQHGVASAGVLAIDGNPVSADDSGMTDYQPFRASVDRAVEVAIGASLTALTG